MTFIILEDEMIAAQRLARMVKEIYPDWQQTGVFESVEELAGHLLSNGQPDVLFMDIQVADGNSFELFNVIEVKSKLIFTTAYSEFAVNAFRHNAVDYLMKPINGEELRKALDKLSWFDPAKNKELTEHFTEFKNRFLIKFGSKLTVVNTSDLAYVYSENKIGYFVQRNGHKVASDYKLQDLESQLDPKYFFRVNRQFIVHIDSISSMNTYSKARINLRLNPEFKEDIIISTEKTPEFKEWLGSSR
ncbi:MAG: response regulator transcription factor [Saprospiraceae bacterium]|nr:response regulator transcription factor [Saprospiraceae bacterium]MBP9193125.1 response regulator transcription factor [Saprospiraceae bacterium]